MLINFDGPQLLRFKKPIEHETCDEHVDVIKFNNIITKSFSILGVLMIDIIKVNSWLIDTLFMFPLDGENIILVSSPVMFLIEFLVKLLNGLLEIGLYVCWSGN